MKGTVDLRKLVCIIVGQYECGIIGKLQKEYLAAAVRELRMERIKCIKRGLHQK